MNCMDNRDTELAIIGTAMQDPACASMLAGAPETLFASADTRALHSAVKRMVARGDACDLITMSSEARCDLDEPEQLLIDCASRGFMPSMYRQYEAILHGCARRRTLAEAARRIIENVNNPAVDEEALCAETVSMLQSADGTAHSVSMQDACLAFWESMNNAEGKRVLTGLPDLDRVTGGFREGQYIAVGARPGVGKSAFALFSAMNIVRTRGPVLLVSMEMAAHEIFGRQVAAESGIDGMEILTNQLDEEAYKAVASAAAELSREGLWIDTSANTPLQVRREAVRLKARHGLAAIVIDYIQLMQPDNRCGSRYEAVCEISRQLKKMAMDLQLPVIVLTQFNRQSEGGQNGQAKQRAPQMSESRDSGAIEQDANTFLILYSPPPPETALPGDPAWETYHRCQVAGWEQMEIIIDKNRSGRKGIVYLGFDKAHMRFHCIDRRR